MNTTEANQFFRKAFIAFPGVKEWIERYSSDPAATLATWSTALSSVDLREAEAVLNRWISGSLPAPAGYQREMFAIHIRQVVQQDRDKVAKERASWEQKQKIGDKSSMRGYVSHMPFAMRMFENGDRYKSGEITKEECESLNNAILAEFDEACRKANKYTREDAA